jgi:hypothetical protein
MGRTYIQIRDWFDDFGARATRTNDRDRMRLYQLYDAAYKNIEKAPEQALSLYREAAHLAEQLNETWIVLVYECWVIETLLFGLARYEEGLDLATKLVSKASQELYAECPAKAWAFYTLIAAYAFLDELSYTSETRAMIETVETMALDEETYLRMIYQRSYTWWLDGNPAKAYEQILFYLDISQSSYRKTGGHDTLCYFYYLQGDDQKALENAHLTEEHAAKSGRRSKVASAYWWQALLMHLRGETKEAERLFWRGIGEMNQLGYPKDIARWLGACRYYEMTGAYDKALLFWDEQVQLMNPKTPARQSYFTVFLRRCFVLRKLGRLTNADVEQTRQIALLMHKPEKYLALVDPLNDGSIEIPRY